MVYVHVYVHVCSCVWGWTSSELPITWHWYFSAVSCVFRCRMWPEFSLLSREDKVSHSVSVCVLPVDRTRQSGWPSVWTWSSHCLYNLSENILPNADPRGYAIRVRNGEKKKEEKTDRGPNSGRQSQRQKGPQLLSQLTLILLPAKTLLHLSVSGSINQSLSYKHTYNIPEVVM